MREHLIEFFTPNRDDNYTYQELVALRAAGKDIPRHWIMRQKQSEDAENQERALNDAIAADLAAADKAHRAEVKAKEDRLIPELEDKITLLDSLSKAEVEAATKARDAVRELLAAHRATLSQYGAIRRTVKEEFGEAVRDDEGNPLPGQTGLDNIGEVLVKGDPVDRPRISSPWHEDVFNQSYFR